MTLMGLNCRGNTLQRSRTEAKSPLLQGWSAESIKLDNLLDKTVTKQAQQHCKQTGIRTNTKQNINNKGKQLPVRQNL